MNKQDRADLAGATIVTVGMILTFLVVTSTQDISRPPVSDREEAIVFTIGIKDTPEYKECVKRDLMTIPEFRDCLKELGAM